jgi:hypothetical protein
MSSLRGVALRALLVAVLLGVPDIVKAISIPVLNGGFESPVATYGGLTLAGTPPDHWFSPDYVGGGLWDINHYPYGVWNAPAPEGNQVLYVGSFRGPDWYQQTLTHNIQANSQYTLTGSVGNPIGYVTQYTAELLAIDGQVENVLASFSDSGPEGSFKTFSVQFDSTGSAAVGLALTIRLISDTQTCFDDIKLDGPAVAAAPGDFNADGKVDAADYVAWRKNDGGSTALPNDNGLGTPIGPGHYALWRANFGNGAGSGTALGNVAVPEPASIVLLAGALIALTVQRRSDY